MLAPRTPSANEGIHALAAARALALRRTQPDSGSRRASRRPGPVAKGKTLVTPIQDTLPQDQAADEEALARELRLTDLDHSWAIAAAASRDSRQGKSEKPQGIRAANPEPGGMRVRRGARAARDRRARCSTKIRNRRPPRRRNGQHALSASGNTVRRAAAPRRSAMPPGSGQVRRHRRHLSRDQHRPQN